MKAISVYIGLAYFLSILLSLLIGLTGGQNSTFIGLGFASMLIPAFGVVILNATMNEAPSVNWGLFPVKYLPLALFLIPFVMHAAMLPMTDILEGTIPWQQWLHPATDGLYHAPADKSWGTVTHSALVFRIAFNAIIGVVVVSVMAFFEEVGWRGWLLPRLSVSVGARSAVVVTSAIWALWHLPFIFSGILKMDGVTTLTTLAVAPFGTFAAGLFIGWLWLRSKSIWIVSIAHGALNNWGQYAFKYVDDFKIASPALVLFSGSLALLLVSALLLWFGLGKSSLNRRY